MTTSAKKGLHNTGSVPYGYRLEGESAVPDGDRAEFVKHVFEAYAKGETPAELYREMQRRGLDTKVNGRKVSDNISARYCGTRNTRAAVCGAVFLSSGPG